MVFDFFWFTFILFLFLYHFHNPFYTYLPHTNLKHFRMAFICFLWWKFCIIKSICILKSKTSRNIYVLCKRLERDYHEIHSKKGKLGAKCGERLLNCLGHYLEINATERIWLNWESTSSMKSKMELKKKWV